MQNVGIKGNQIIDKNVYKILSTFSTLLRKKSKTVIPQLQVNDPVLVSTNNINRESTGIGNLRRGSTIFYTEEWNNEILGDHQVKLLESLIEDESLPRSAIKEQNQFLFKTPLNIVITSADPERKFVECLCKKDIVERIDSWIKSRDRGFYGIEFSLKYGGKGSKTRRYGHKTFNPDFFIKITKGEMTYFIVTEIKADKDDSLENRAKYRYAKEHFDRLNNSLLERKINQTYIFHFLSPNGYTEFFEYLKDGTLLEGQSKFRCELENLLEAED